MKSTLCEPSFREAIMRALLHACVAVLAIAAAMPSLSWAQTPAPSITKEMAAGFQRASNDILDVAEAMPAEKYGYKPAAEMSTFSDQLVHVAGIVQRFVDTSKGMKTEAAHHGAMGKPEVIVLDEPTAGLDPAASATLKDKILAERAAGRTIVVTSHIMSEIEELSDDIVFLLEGAIRYCGSVQAIKTKTRQASLERAVATMMIREVA